ncbi:MAG: hypothetical protein [Circular genetic element sp.]|nr:MAG: hypothetical protein [Circular genetic element sp.]
MPRTKSTPRRGLHMTTHYGRGARKGFNRSQALKVTSRKGAYAPARKANFQVRRAPFVETKHQTDVLVSLKSGNQTGTPADTLRLTTEPLQITYGTSASGSTPADPKELTILPINSFMNMNQGFDQSDMIGTSIFSKYLKCKLEFQLPYGANQIRHPCDMFLIHGWITQPIGNTLHTTPDSVDFTRSNYTEHIEEQLLQYFNQRSDKLDYIPKITSNVKFEGYQKLKVKRSTNLGPDPTTLALAGLQQNTGAHPPINMTVKWNMMKKVHYEKGTAGTTVSPLEFYYPNHSWIPFVALYNPTAVEFLSSVTYPGSAPGSNSPPDMYVRYNSIHYFTDS